MAGTDDVESIALLRGSEEVAVHPDQPARSADTVRVAWRGARNGDRQRPLRWDGALEISGGVFDDARGWAFDSPAEGLHQAAPSRLAWRSVTTGDEDGVLVDVAGGDEATLTFRTAPIACEVRLGDIRRAVVEHAGPGVDTAVRFEMTPSGIGRDVTAVLRDPTPPRSGCHAYWIRVRQTEGAKAWVSPFFVTVQSDYGAVPSSSISSSNCSIGTAGEVLKLMPVILVRATETNIASRMPGRSAIMVRSRSPSSA